MRSVSLLSLGAAGLCGLLTLGASAQPGVTTLPLVLNTAEVDGRPVVTRRWAREQVANANTLFRPHRVAFEVHARHAMDGSHARLENRVDRHLLGHLLHPQRIDVFFVESLRDVDEPERYRQGVHWRPRGDAYPERAHFVIVSSIAGPTVLAHELGHYFGNGHSDVPGNIMCYERGDVPPFFDETQGARIRFSVRRFLRDAELVRAEDAASGSSASGDQGDVDQAADR